MLYDKKISQIDKAFLFIYFPNSDLKLKIDWYDFDLNTLQIYKTNIFTNYSILIKKLDIIGGEMSKYFFYTDIKPLQQFNQEKG